MKKCFKYTLYSLILLIFTVFLSSCHSMYPISFEFEGYYMVDKTIDILIPISENDTNYIDSATRYYNILSKYKQFQGNYDDEDIEDELKKTEIYKYNENGYKSMLCHFRTEDFSKSSIDDNKVNISIYLDSKQKFKQLCEEYKTFRIAVVGMKGEILNISEEIPFKSSKEYYIDSDISYDPINNTVSPVYLRQGKFRFWLLLIDMLMYIAPVWSIALLIAVIFLKDAKSLKFPYSIFESAAMTLPLTVFLAVRYDDAIKSTLTQNAALEQFFDLGDISVLSIIFVFIPYVSFLTITILTCIKKTMKR